MDAKVQIRIGRQTSAYWRVTGRMHLAIGDGAMAF